MTLLRDHDLARAFDHASHSYDLLTALNPGYRTALLRSARRLRLPRAGSGLHALDFDSAPAFTDRLTGKGFTGVRAAPVAGWQTGSGHTFLARNGFASAAEYAG